MSDVINLGKPIITAYDDFRFIVNDDTELGYFSSNRAGSKGGNKIYWFVQLEDLRIMCEVLVTGTLDSNSGEPLLGALATIMEAYNNQVDQVTTRENKNYVFKLECVKQ